MPLRGPASVLLLLCLGGPVGLLTLHGETYSEERIRILERDLDASRESLHRAHRELARKAERMALLEELLEQHGIEVPPETGGAGSERGERKSTRKKLSEAIRKIKELEKRLLSEEKASRSMTGKKQEESQAGAKTEKDSKRPSGAEILIEYEEDSAVSLEGRDRVLAFVQSVRKRSPGARFRVEGGADDTDYETADRVIAENRARFLVDFLKYSGCPGGIFVEVIGLSTKNSSGARRFVRVSVVSG